MMSEGTSNDSTLPMCDQRARSEQHRDKYALMAQQTSNILVTIKRQTSKQIKLAYTNTHNRLVPL